MAINEITVKSLLQFDGANGGTTFTDNAGLVTWTRYGNAKTSTANIKFGSASGLFDGNGDYLQSVYNEALDLIGDSFVIEGWAYPTTTKTNHRIFATGGGWAAWGNSGDSLHVMVDLTNTNTMRVQLSSGTTTPRILTTTAVMTLNTWNHFVVQFDASTNVLMLGINGTLASTTIAAPVRPSMNPVATIATASGEAGSATYAWNGRFDSFRISKGTTGGYSGSTYTVPTAPYDIPAADPSVIRKTRLTLTYSYGSVTNGANSIVSDNVYATYGTSASPGGNGYSRYTTNAASVIPANAIVRGVEFKVEARANTVTPKPAIIAGPGGFGGSGSNMANLTTGDTWYTFGGPEILLGSSGLGGNDPITEASIRMTTNANGSATIYLDAITMDVYWHLPSNFNGLFFGRPI